MLILKPELFEGAESKKKLEMNSLTVLTQYTNEQSPQTVQLLEKFFGDSYLAFLGANLILTLIFSTSMQFMWGLINTLQIIVLTVLFDLKTPINVLVVLIQMLQLSNFNLFPTDLMYNTIFDFTETEPFNQVFEEAGFENSNFILLAGPFLLLVILYFLWTFIQKILLKIPKVKQTLESKISQY